jgi:hypothetical protein
VSRLDQYLLSCGLVMMIIAFENAACKIVPSIGRSLDAGMLLLLVYWFYFSAISHELIHLVTGEDVSSRLTNLEMESGMRYPRHSGDKTAKETGVLKPIQYQEAPTESMWGELGEPLKSEVQKRWAQAYSSGWKSEYAGEYTVCIHEADECVSPPTKAPSPGWSSPGLAMKSKVSREDSQGKKKKR